MATYLCAVLSRTTPHAILLLIFCFAVQRAAGQTAHITCHVTDRTDQPVPFAAIQVAAMQDSANNHYEGTTDTLGNITFDLLQGRQYLVRSFALNYKNASRNIMVTTGTQTFTIKLEDDSKMLKTVEVTFKKPLMKQVDDKTIVDPEELAASSTNAYDIMEKIPGLFVDQDGNIYLTSSTPATVYINGREQKMSNADVATMLKSLPPNSIERIEILRTPSTKFDASSSGGVVNVVLKKGVKIGLTGSVNTGANQGTYGNQYAGLVLNNNNGTLSTSLNLQASHRATGERLMTNRTFAPDSMLAQDAYTKYPGYTYYAGYNIGYSAGKKWELNYDGRISLNNNTSSSSSPAVIKRVSTDVPSASYRADVQNDNDNINLSQGVSIKYKIDTAGSEWTTDANYNYVPTDGTQAYQTMYYQPATANISGNGDITARLHNFTAQTDVVRKLPHRISLEAGLKASNIWFSNKTSYTLSVNNAAAVADVRRTNSYDYDEHIYAGYLQASKGLGSLLLKAGVRAENTNMFGNQTVPSDTSFKLQRTDLFPYVYLSRKVMSIAKYELRAYLIYRRTITRPAYENLNPFPRFIDQYLSEVGNPSLKPQFTTNYEANVSVDDRPIIAFGYNDMTDIFTQVVYQPQQSRQSYRTYDNLGRNREFYMRGLAAIPPGKTYFFVVGAQYNNNFYEGIYDGAPLSYKRTTWSLFTYQTLKLGKLTQVVLNGFVRFKGQVQFYELSTFGALNLSVNRQFLDKKLKVTASVNDLFLTNNNTFVIDQGNIYATGLRKGDTRRFGVSAIYTFGIRKKEEHNFFGDDATETSK